MKAMIWTRYGPPDVLQLQEVAKPAPKDDEVLIELRLGSLQKSTTVLFLNLAVATTCLASSCTEADACLAL
jgi:NADPH:quinone reductase-like Zn-dependent oxidoreductase